eukprot:TRINITY_DN6863_c0_g1_i1.p1 TRINITY_DN6863_c0_g1~~TRINITY_DN6863_c0_g1_i1.p1  ORF type:complete len:188 (+),score=71.84 TRINITY_DN6863_c0_g1_i1:295-858(+)
MVVKQRKVLLMGSPAVGKSSITIQFVENHFVDSYNPTIENTFSKMIKYRGVEYDTKIVDTAGTDDSDAIQEAHTIGIHGYILIYSVASKSSYEKMKVLNDKILTACGTDKVPRVLCGNKMDLHLEREVQRDEVAQLARSWGCSFLECSAKHNENIEDLFRLMIAEIEKENTIDQTKKPQPASGCVMM